MSERTLSVLDGSTFVVSDRLGDVRIDEGRDHGFFCQDTRFLLTTLLDLQPGIAEGECELPSIGHVELRPTHK